MPTSINASPSEIDRSKKARYGNRYYPVDESYDKRVYENSVWNYIRIILTLIAFWIFQAIHWWGVFELGTNFTDLLMYYSFAIFGFTIFVGAIMLTSGKYANKKKRQYEYLRDVIALKKSERLERELKDQQEADYQMRAK